MKKTIMLFVFSMLLMGLYSQDNNKECSFRIFAGFKYTPIDYVGGGIVGFAIKKQNMLFSLRNDVSLAIEKNDSMSYFGINKYRVSNYLDVHYCFTEKFCASVGYGWVSNKNQIHRFNSDFGYSVLSVGVNYYATHHIAFELKGDVPFADWNSPVDQNIAFPVSIGLIYFVK